MAEKEGGVMTRSRRNRSQSRELSGGAAGSGSSKAPTTGRPTNLESVAEDMLNPSPPIGSQKSVRTDSSMSLGLNGSSQQSNGAGSRAASPLSLSRAQEKEELQNLNNRLANILNKLSDSEEENRILKVRLTTIEKETSADLTDQLAKYSGELERARQALDDIAREKDREVLAGDKALAELREAKAQLEKAKARTEEAENRTKAAEKLARDGDAKLADAKAALADSDAARLRLETELNEVRRQLGVCQKNLEQEVLLRAGLENALKTAEEKLNFEAELHTSKLQKLERYSTSVNTVDSTHSYQRRSGADFTASIMDMRTALEDAREEIEQSVGQMYGQQIESLEAQRDSLNAEVKDLRHALTLTREDQKELQNENKELRNKIIKLEKELEQVNQKCDKYKYDSVDRIASLTEQNNEIGVKHQQLLDSYRVLRDSHTDLHTELNVYRELMDRAETDAGISPILRKKRKHESTYSTPLGAGSSRFVTPRTVKTSSVRTTVKTSENKSHATGPIRILEVVPGKAIRIENTSETLIPLSGWVLKQVGDLGEAFYQFAPDHKVIGRGIISVYSATEVNAPSNGTTDILADHSWEDSARLETVLLDQDGREVANYCVSADTAMGLNRSMDSPRSGGLFGRLFGGR